MIKKILQKEYYLYFSIFYVVFKNLFSLNTGYATYLVMLYGIFILMYDIMNIGVINYAKNNFLYILMVLAFVLPIFALKRIDRTNFAITMDVIISFLIYGTLFYNKSINDIKKIFLCLCYILFFITFVWSIFGFILIITGYKINFFGVEFGILQNRLQLAKPSVNPTGFMAFSGMVCTFFILVNTLAKMIIKVISYINLCLLLVIIFFTQSMGTFLAIFVAFICFVILILISSKNIYKFVLYVLVSFAILIPIGILILVISGIEVRLFKLDFVSFIVRFDILKYGFLVLMLNHPIIGSSYSGMRLDWITSFDYLSSKYIFCKEFYAEPMIINTAATHNTQLSYVGSTGLIGFILLAIFYVYELYNIIRLIRNVRTLSFIDRNLVFSFIIIIFSTFAISLTSESMITSITDYANILFFTSISAINQITNIIFIKKNNKF